MQRVRTVSHLSMIAQPPSGIRGRAPMGKRLAKRIDPEKTRWRGSALAAYQFLALQADDKTRIVRGISVEKIAAYIGLSPQRTKTIMQCLKEGNAVETLERGGGRRTNVYRISLAPARTSGAI